MSWHFDVADVRKRPAMYVGGTSARGIDHMVNEVVSNSLDQFFHGEVTEIDVSICNSEIVVRDNGLGFKCENDDPSSIATHFLTYHDSPSVDEHAPHVHLYTQGVGLVVVNALSERLSVKTRVGNKIVDLKFSKSMLVDTSINDSDSDWKGTEVRFVPDREIFGDAMPRRSELRRLLFDAVHLFPGIKIGLNEEHFYAPEGLIEYGNLLDHGGAFQNVSFSMRERIDDFQVDIALVGWADGPCRYLSWANGARTTVHGSHVDALKQCVQQVKHQYFNPSLGLIHVVMHRPEFAGPTRGELRTPHIVEPLAARIKARIESYLSPKAG